MSNSATRCSPDEKLKASLVFPSLPERLNLENIERALLRVQRQLPTINGWLTAEHAAFSDEELYNLLAGYHLVDMLVATGTDLFALGNSRQILELNNIVLYGSDELRRRQRHAAQLKASMDYFYDQDEGGIGDLVEFYQRLRSRDAWNRAASIYVRMQAQPQLFVEGNHRTGALLMSYVLLQAGLPPFVLTSENAKLYFNPSSKIGRFKKRSLAMYFNGGPLRRHFVQLLQHSSDPDYLITVAGSA